ncbi:hypothetical protein BD410DRAFT_793255 [Rickenella mellea]|uniref:Zn(2)-C6 fungal-type domain-containing protein n=1 Tax=Rickenella mellea TaxID=50990 RepID=A0A4Y7PVC4_9AGAM|nr:hypothetical protein BD410DRAFT_793255 [Rickenella mellea]
MDNGTPSADPSTGDATHTYLSKAPARRGRTRDTNPHPCVLCKKSHLRCNALPPFSKHTCERCFTSGLICEQPDVGGGNQEDALSDSDAWFHPYAATPSRKIAGRKSSTKKARRTITTTSSEVAASGTDTELPQTQTTVDQPKEASLVRQEIVPQPELSPLIEHSTYEAQMDSFTSYGFGFSSYHPPLESLEQSIDVSAIYEYVQWDAF